MTNNNSETRYFMSIEKGEYESTLLIFNLASADENVARKVCEDRYFERLNLGLSDDRVVLLDTEFDIIDIFTGDKWLNDAANTRDVDHWE